MGTWMFIIFGLVAALSGIYAANYAPEKTVYEYDVKAEQVYDNGKINESVTLQELSQDEQKILYDAFKETDDFLGGSNVLVKSDQRLDTFDGWKVVEYNGVYLLVAIDGPYVETVHADWTGFVSPLICILSIAISLTGLKEMVAPSPY